MSCFLILSQLRRRTGRGGERAAAMAAASRTIAGVHDAGHLVTVHLCGL